VHFNRSKTSAESGGPTQSSSQELKAKPFHKKVSAFYHFVLWEEINYHSIIQHVNAYFS